MLKKDITYINPFTEHEVTEEHYFHISKADLVEMEMGEHGTKYTAKDGEKLTGMQAKLRRIIDAEDGKAIIAELKDMILLSYGRRDGDRFIKNAKEREDFASSEAFSQLLFELCTDAAKAGEFTSSIVPSNLEQEAARIAAKAQQRVQGDTLASVTSITPQGGSDDETAIEAVERVGDALGAPREPAPASPVTAPSSVALSPERQAEIDNATPEAPVTVAQEELSFLNSHQLKTGLGSGALQL